MYLHIALFCVVRALVGGYNQVNPPWFPCSERLLYRYSGCPKFQLLRELFRVGIFVLIVSSRQLTLYQFLRRPSSRSLETVEVLIGPHYRKYSFQLVGFRSRWRGVVSHLHLDDVTCPFLYFFRNRKRDLWRLNMFLHVCWQLVWGHSDIHDWMIILDHMSSSQSDFSNCRTI